MIIYCGETYYAAAEAFKSPGITQTQVIDTFVEFGIKWMFHLCVVWDSFWVAGLETKRWEMNDKTLLNVFLQLAQNSTFIDSNNSNGGFSCFQSRKCIKQRSWLFDLTNDIGFLDVNPNSCPISVWWFFIFTISVIAMIFYWSSNPGYGLFLRKTCF